MTSLRNRIIAITRSEHDAREFFQLVNAEGWKGIAIPAIRIMSADQETITRFIELLKKKKYDYCAFMSAQAVRVLFNMMEKKEVANALAPSKVIAVGPKTMQELERHGIKADMMPDSFSSVGVVELLSRENQLGKSIIIPRSKEANDFAANALSEIGMKVEEVFLYSTYTAEVTADWEEFGNLLAQKKIDAVIFTSASNVKGFFDIMGKMGVEVPRDIRAISIGPFTTAELVKKSVTCHEARHHTIKGAVDLAKELISSR